MKSKGLRGKASRRQASLVEWMDEQETLDKYLRVQSKIGKLRIAIREEYDG